MKQQKQHLGYNCAIRWLQIFMIILIGFMLLNIAWNSLSEEEPPGEQPIKTILFWNPYFSEADYEFGFGQQPFIDHGCKNVRCFTTNNRSLLPLDQYDALIFHGPTYTHALDQRPKIRSPSQYYVYFSMEAPEFRPVRTEMNGFFNWTMTYRLNSDIFAPYFIVRDANKNVVAPSMDPHWLNPNDFAQFSEEKYMEIAKRKKKPVAWFVSNCASRSGREQYVKDLQKDIPVDIYGLCGPLKCPRNNESVCLEMLKNDYYFYLAFENSICEDYISERGRFPYQNEVVPIVHTGADLSKSLPPGSYLEALDYPPHMLAEKIKHLIASPKEYAKYFWWKEHYSFSVDMQDAHPFCKLCEKLHEPNPEPKIYEQLRLWWHGKGESKCRHFK